MDLYWLSHRLSDDDPTVKLANLRRAHERLAYLRPAFRARGIWLSAQWLDWAEAGVPETEAWERIEIVLPWHDGIVLDLSDGKPMSSGLERERGIMAALGRPVEVVR
jgi:hypothetical protein